MTEDQWLARTDPRPMLDFLAKTGKVSQRKARLFCVACCRRLSILLADEQGRRTVELAERYADGLATEKELVDAYPTSVPVPERSPTPARWAAIKSGAWAHDAAHLAAGLVTSSGLGGLCRDVSYYAAGAVAWKLVGAAPNATEAASWASAWRQAEADEYREQVRLVHDLIDNPFRPREFSSSWRTPDAVTLAGHIYHDRAFRLMPELADVLEEAGCRDREILEHCRDPGLVHARGCRLVDWLLNKK